MNLPLDTIRLDQQTLDDRMIAKAALAGVVFIQNSVVAGWWRCILPDGYECRKWSTQADAARDALYTWEVRLADRHGNN